MTPKTGHYQAGPAELKYFLLFCQKNGVALKEMQVCPDPFDQKKKWFPGDEVLLAGGKEPTPDNIAAEKKVVPVVKVAGRSSRSRRPSSRVRRRGSRA